MNIAKIVTISVFVMLLAACETTKVRTADGDGKISNCVILCFQ